MRSWLPMPTTLSLEPGNNVHLFLTPTAFPPEVIARLHGWLSPDEQAKVARIRHAAGAREALVSRSLLRLVLSHICSIPMRDLHFSVNPHGKPALANGPVQFNLSHSKGMVLLAIASESQLGVDLEFIRDDISHEDLAQRFFNEAESRALAELPPQERLAAFFRCWTRKEAILKAAGRGIAAGLDTFVVPIHTQEDPVQVGPWSLHDVDVGPQYAASLAVESRPSALHCWSCNRFLSAHGL